MSGIEKITGRIKAEAEKNATEVLVKAEADKKAILAKADKQSADVKNKIINSAKSQYDEIIRRRVSVADLESRKLRLLAKQQLIDECFKEAHAKILNLPEADYINLLANYAVSAAAEGGEIALNQKDKDAIGAKLVDEVNSRLSKAGINKSVILSNQVINVDGGFVIRNGSVEINNTIGTIVNSYRDDLISDVVAVLFN